MFSTVNDNDIVSLCALANVTAGCIGHVQYNDTQHV